MKTDREQLLKTQIQSAFDSVTYPGDSNLADHACQRCEDEVKAFKQQHWKEWQNKALDILLPNRDGIFFFSPEAFRFFLPLFMLASIDHYAEADTIPDSLIYSLTKPREPSLEERASAHKIMETPMPGATPGQMDAVRQTAKRFASKTTVDLQAKIELYKRRIEIFNSDQIDAICAFLQFFLDEYSEDFLSNSIGEALESVSKYKIPAS